MSGGVLFQEALRTLSRAGLDPLAERAVLRSLEAAKRGGPLDLIYDCAAAGKIERPLILARGSAVFFSFAAGNLADDIADGDCEYLEDPVREGPTVQFILQNLFLASAAESGVSGATLARIGTDLARAAGPQLLELRTSTWTVEAARTVGEGIAGLQYGAYLELLWAGTQLEAEALTVGRALGIAAHVARDLATHDPRAVSLSPDGLAELLAWAKTQANIVRALRLPCLDATLRSIDPVLDGVRP